MKYKKCPGYDADTEMVKREIGSAGGEILYKDVEIVLSERCSALNLMDNFDCSKGPMREILMAEEKAKKQNKKH